MSEEKIIEFLNQTREVYGDEINIEKTIISNSNKFKKEKYSSDLGTFYNQINMNLSQAYDYASNVMVENMLKIDAEEGIDAFINKRNPNWQDK